MNNSLKVEFESWYIKPEMMGHRWAKDQVTKVKGFLKKYAVTTKQIAVIQFCLSLNSTDWHYWNFLTDKYLRQLQYVCRRIDKNTPLELLQWLNNHSGCLKNELTWYLENASYKKEQSDYLRYYIPTYTFYGMSTADATDRFHRYHTEILSKHFDNQNSSLSYQNSLETP